MAEIMQALQVQLSPTATPEQRRATFDLLNQVTESPSALAVGFALAPAAAGHDQRVRFFGLKCLEHQVRYAWSSHSPDARAAAVNALERLATEGMSADGESNLLKTKLAAVIVEVAKREWPQTWDLNAVLTTMFAASPTHKELVFLVLTGLVQDVYDVDFSDEVVLTRKRVLMKAVNSIVLSDDLYAQELARDLKPFQAGTKIKEVEYVPGEQGRVGWFLATVMFLHPVVVHGPTRESAPLAVAALHALAAMVPWISAKLMAQAGLIMGLAQLLPAAKSVLQVQYAAAETLYLVCARNYPQPGEVLTLFEPFLDGGMVVLVVQTLIALDQNDADAFDVMKLLVQAIVDVGVRQVCAKANVTWIPARLAAYISTLLELQQHPSVTLSTSIVSFWLTALKHPYLKESVPILEALPRVLEKAIVTFERKASTDEFPNKKHRERAETALKSHTQTVVKLVAAMAPTAAAQWTLTQLTAGTHLQGVLALIDAGAQGMLKDAAALRQIYQYLLSRLAQAAADRDSQQVLALTRSASHCVGAIGQDMAPLLPLLETMINYATDDRQVRYAMLGQLSRVALAVPDLVLALSADIEKVATQLPYAEKCHVIECLFVAIVHTTTLDRHAYRANPRVDEIPERVARTRALLDPLVSQFSSDVREFVPTAEALVALCDPHADHRQHRSQIMLPMVTLNAVFKRARASWFPAVLDGYVVEVAQRVMGVIQAAHALTDPQVAKAVPLVKALQDIPVYIKQAYLQQQGSGAPQTPADHQLLKIQMWMEQIKPNAYTLLGHLLRPPFYAIPNIAQHTIQAVFANVATVENRHLAALLRCFVEPLVVHCPASARATVVLPIVPELCKFVVDRLTKEWTQHTLTLTGESAQDAGSDGEDDDDEHDASGEGKGLTAEIVHDRQLRSLTVGFMDMLSVWFVQNRKQAHAEPGLAEFVFERANVTLLEAVVFALLSMFRCGEPAAVAKALQVLKALLPHFTQAHHPVLATFVVRGVLAGLKHPAHAELADLMFGFLAQVLVGPMGPPSREMVLQTLLEEGVPQASLALFAQMWPTYKTDADREKAVHGLLAPLVHGAVGDRGKLQKSAAVTAVNKVMIAPQSAAGHGGGADEDEDYGSLFDESNALDSAL
ncbi:Exportin-5 [Allomyces arbusculus]|nr:Exportin-5 [Allomyces arbusculus]